MLNSKSKRFAMTLAEVLMCIGIFGVIAAITLPMLGKVLPSKIDSFHKKANYLVEQVVSQLYDDETMYPRKSDFYSQGFQNTEKVTINGVEYEGDDKFCKLFASKFVISSESGALVCENEIAETNTTLARGKKSFTAQDGIDWFLPVTDFQKGSAEIMVDVNGKEMPNCLEGEENCANPDRFLYYVKPDGAITYTKPENVIKDKFQITVNVTTDGCPGGTCTEVGGTYEIAKLNSAGNIVGSWSEVPSAFKNLESNTRYILRAKPKADYYVDWSTDPNIKSPTKRVKIYNSDLKVDLKFHKKSNYCIIVDLTNCDKENVTECATTKITSGCGYKKVSNKNGPYMLNDDGTYTYVGLGVDGGEYEYTCDGLTDVYGNPIESHTYTLTNKGHPIKNDDGSISADTTYQAVYKCDGLITGDYQLEVTPKSGYKVAPITTEHPNGRYKQEIRLGTEDVSIEVSLSR